MHQTELGHSNRDVVYRVPDDPMCGGHRHCIGNDTSIVYLQPPGDHPHPMGSAAGKQIYIAEYLYNHLLLPHFGAKAARNERSIYMMHKHQVLSNPPGICASGKEGEEDPKVMSSW